ncbi:hypothetical protein MCAP1_001086 [Malassezia caprae]|uniref:Coiled-coil domain-containing protein 137 n=1 Tax=Malassezia caprae TaxID=1381934 RepID=A0AAF0E7D8_9BASI|nr:hypothetical protein MCAP1_001086 [Malassezia caprae]
MPRKRAKHSVRQTQRESLGHDLPPGPKRVRDDMPRKAAVLFRPPPPRPKADEPPRPAEAPLQIRPGEKLRDFNERVEQAFSSDLNRTMRAELRSESNQKKRQRRRELLKAKKRAADPAAARAAEEAADFERASQARSLRDVAQAPPTITARPKERLKRKAPALVEAQAQRPKPSAARQRILDEERQRVIAQYRSMKGRS